ncbi:MAG TPA: ATP-grasp domain-containing protein [Candidatus Hydrogenedentes bacterium]|nr:ATP-grasp domain-containing protein [Candidatus Hydrogenedentota bacterium]
MPNEPSTHERSRVLVFPCGTEIGLAIYRALSWSTHVALYGASSVASNHGKYVFSKYAEGLPFVHEARFLPELNGLIKRWGIDFVFPAHDSVVLELAQRQGELACAVIGSPPETCAICRDKAETYRRLRAIVRTPAVFDAKPANMPFPVFLKPRVGQGSRGVYMADSPEALDLYMKRDPSLLVLEYLTGAEYTIDCLTDRHGALRFAGARERVRVVNGISVHTRPVEGEEFQEMAKRINNALVLRGAWFFQAKRDDKGELVLLEAAPRVSGGMGLYRNLGVNLPLLSLFDAQDHDIEVLCHTHSIEMDRALCNRFRLRIEYDEVYIDLDDTLILDGLVNPMVVAFVYQCLNRGIPVHLVSRHAGDIHETLARHRLTGLFDSIVHLDRLACKSRHINGGKPIFIDDSFAERKRVYEALGIPTFSVDAVESLMDWRT